MWYKRRQPAGETEAGKSTQEEHPGILALADDPSDDWNVLALTRNGRVSIPSWMGGRRVLRLNLQQTKQRCDEMLARLTEEKVDVSDPQNQYFHQLMSEGSRICGKLLDRTSKPRRK